MADAGLLGLYWGPRRESVDDCADKWLRSLLALTEQGFSTYYRRARSRNAALRHPIALDRASIRSILAARTQDTDLGFRFSAWSGDKEGEAYSVSGTCGAWSDGVSNNCLINLPPAGRYSISKGRGKLKKVFADLVGIWDPDKAILCDASELAWDDKRFASTMRSYERFERAAL